jgi:hypothetical protein
LFIKFLETVNGSDDGVNLKRFKTGGIYKIPSDLSKELAKVFIENEYAVEIEEKEIKEFQQIKNLDLEETEIIDIEEIEKEEADVKLVQKVEEVREKSVFKRNFGNNNKYGKKK